MLESSYALGLLKKIINCCNEKKPKTFLLDVE